MHEFFHYHFLDGRLIGSENPGVFGDPTRCAAEICGKYSIKHIVTLTDSQDPYTIKGVARYHIPLGDNISNWKINPIFSIIDRALANNEAVWIHCERGIDRTGSVIGRYLVSHGNNADDVIGRLLNNFAKQVNHPRLRNLWQDKIEFIRAGKVASYRSSSGR